MQENVEYQIFIGCMDPHTGEEVVNENKLRNMVSEFFKKHKINFSMLSIRGCYIHKNGWIATENTLCINIVGGKEEYILKLAKSLSMFMNQESCLITKNILKSSIILR